MNSIRSTKKTGSIKKNSASKRRTQNSAAKKIQRVFRNYRLRQLKKLLKDPSCLLKPISIKNENIYMYVKKEDKEEHLFNLFNFKPTSGGIKEGSFFARFHEMVSTEFNDFDGITHEHKFFFAKKNDGFSMEVLGKDSDELKSKYESLMQTHFLPCILYILANCKLNFAEFDENNGFLVNMSHPKNVSEIIGIHKDETIRTCLLYVDSPLSTEIAFDTETVNLPWFSCSPLFRFKTTDKLYMLCFNDELIEHTVPFFEEEGKDVAEINPLEEYETLREKDGFLEFGEISTSSTGKDVYQNKNGTLKKLPRKERVDSLGNPVSLKNVVYRFKKPTHRKKVPRPEVRKILTTFVLAMKRTTAERQNQTILKIDVPFSTISDYKIDSLEERIELTEDSITSIVTKSHLGDFEFSG